MLNTIKILIVSPPHYLDLSRRISHEISSIIGCTSKVWSIKTYLDSEVNLANNQHVIFIGNPEENVLSKDYLPVMKTKLPGNKAGIFYAYNDSKAIVFGEGKLDQLKEFEKLRNVVKYREMSSRIRNGRSVNGIFPAAIALFSIVGIGSILFFIFYTKRQKEKKLRKEQTKLALTLFLFENFEKWLNLKTEVVEENV